MRLQSLLPAATSLLLQQRRLGGSAPTQLARPKPILAMLRMMLILPRSWAVSPTRSSAGNGVSGCRVSGPLGIVGPAHRTLNGISRPLGGTYVWLITTAKHG
ncbi:hypothetical protein AWC27_23150 [Mycobacterium szulgai]|uniref:Uncharacterized protein n=1 Tax=Mycobacterium szulgai TaxID=1787 RepID=A0A1X2F3G3_MYCSZ|nr:hypothetical protein AWC27_23150 [Mycobacterium szulgai]